MTVRGRPRPASVAAHVVLGALALRLWDAVLFRRDQDEPLLFAAWLAALVAAFVWARRPRPITIVWACVFAALVFVFHWGYERAASDGREYFAQVRSIVFDRDFDFANEAATLGTRGAARMYPFGLAVLWVPFMVLAHAWLLLQNLFGAAHSVDGFTNPYQRAVGFGTLLYGFTGLVLAWRVVCDYVGERLALVATLGAAAGTFMVWYIVIESSMSHAASMFGAAWFLYVWHRGRAKDAGLGRSRGGWLLLGAATGVMTMVRWQNALIAIPPLLLSLWQARRRGWADVGRSAALVAASGLVAAFPQLLFWRVVRGSWLSLPASDHGWDPAALHIADILFSPNHGLLSVTPLAYLALVGLPFFYRRDRVLTVMLVVLFAGQVLANAASGDWWGGPGFGARRFDSALLAFAIGLVAWAEWCRRRPLVAPALVLAAFVGLNTVLMIDVRRSVLPAAEAITLPDAAASVYRRFGNPFSFPYNAWVASRFDADWSLLDRLEGRTYNNIDVDIGDRGDEMFLTRGWFGPERDTDGRTFRWATGPLAAMVVPLKTADRYRLSFVVEPFAPAGGPRQTIEVVVNGTRVAHLGLRDGFERHEVEIPASALRRNLNLIQFRFAHALAPRDAGLSADGRALAVRFDSLSLVRNPGGGS